MTTPPSSPPPALPTRRVGRFYLTQPIGTGSDGSVYLGHDPVIDRDVAIKLLRIAPGAPDKRQREQQFINEARAAGRLSHPNIVTIFDASNEGGCTYIAMEFLPGKDLRDQLAEGKAYEVMDVVHIIAQVAEALAYAHANGVIHRDIKPANIFVLPNLQAKVVDFGIARAPNRVLDDNGYGHTLFNNNILGTPNYMSPEQAMGKPVTALTDVYSLAAVMYEMLTLHKPFQSHDIDKLLLQIANKKMRAPSEFNAHIPASLEQILNKAMQKNPAERYQSADDFAHALRKFIARDQKLKRRRRHVQEPDTPSASAHKSRGNWLSWIALGLAGAAVLYSLFK